MRPTSVSRRKAPQFDSGVFFLYGWGCFRAGLHKSGDNSLPALGIFKWVSLLMIRRWPGFTAELMLGCVSCWGVELLGARWEHIQSRRHRGWSYANPVRKCWHLIWGKFIIQEFAGRLKKKWEGIGESDDREAGFDRDRHSGAGQLHWWPHKMRPLTHLCRWSVKGDPRIKVATGPCCPSRLPDRSIHPETAFVWFKCHPWCDQHGIKWSGEGLHSCCKANFAAGANIGISKALLHTPTTASKNHFPTTP